MPFIPLEVFANNPVTTVSAGGTTGPASGTAETWTVANSSPFPQVEIGATQFHVADPALPGEVITVQNISGTTWSVIRGAESTTPVPHAPGFAVVQVVTAGVMAAAYYPPWQFPVQAYGAQGDGKTGAGGTGASGQPVLTDTSATFVNASAPAGDVGKVIIVNQGAGSSTAATNPFCGTIIAVNSPTSVTLNANLAAACTNAPYIYGTDDAFAITAAVNAAVSWAKTTGNYKAQVVFEPQNYMLAGLTQTLSPYVYNTHIPVQGFSTQYDRKLILDFIGTGSAADPDFWGSTVPNLQGTCLVSAVFPAAQPDAAYGQQSVIGTPSTSAGIGNGGISGGSFANVLVTVDGISAVMPYNGQQYGFDFRTAAQAVIEDAAALAFAPVNFAAQPCGGTWLRSGTIPGNGVAVGLAMPVAGNNDNNNIRFFSAEGLAIGLQISEHFTAQRIATMYCTTGIQVEQGLGLPVHGGSILFWSCEGGNTGLKGTAGGSNGQYPLFIANADFEAMTAWYVADTANTLTGTMYWQDIGQASPVGASISVNGAQNYHIVNTRMYPGPWAANAGLSIPAPPSAPASGTAQQNTAFMPATVYLSATTGITVVSVGPASTGLTVTGLVAASAVTVPVRVPGGHWYSVTYTGTLTTKWVLE